MSSAAAPSAGPVSRRFNYYRRIFSAYLTSNTSQLTFWHEDPQMNPRMRADEVGEYYMPFVSKANYSGPKDDSGVPLLDYRGLLGCQYNPIAIAQYGLGNYNLYVRESSEARRREFLLIADWLVANLEPNQGGFLVWNHHFDWDYRTRLIAPWYSGLAQGQGISLLVRAWKHTGREHYLRAASDALESFFHDVSEGGVSFSDSEGNLWFEEYIVHPHAPTHILNGFIWASWGVYDYWLVTRDPRVKELFDTAIRTMRQNLPRFDTGFWSLYEQSGTRMKMMASPFYHRLHIAQLRVLNALTGDEVFGHFADRWQGYAANGLNRRRAFAYKAIFKLLYY